MQTPIHKCISRIWNILKSVSEQHCGHGNSPELHCLCINHWTQSTCPVRILNRGEKEACMYLGFLSAFFLTPKKRPGTLKWVHRPKWFRMETLHGGWMPYQCQHVWPCYTIRMHIFIFQFQKLIFGFSSSGMMETFQNCILSWLCMSILSHVALNDYQIISYMAQTPVTTDLCALQLIS